MFRVDRRALHAIAAVSVLALSGPGVAIAQQQSQEPQAQQPQQPQAQQPQQQAQEFSEEKLDSFVAAAIEVEELVAEWSPKIEAAQDEQAAEELRAQANEELAAAIESTDGITMAEYQQIAQAARTDQQLAQRLQAIYQEKQGS